MRVDNAAALERRYRQASFVWFVVGMTAGAFWTSYLLLWLK